MDVTAVRVASRPRFATIDRRAANDERLSFRARGVLLWLLDKPDDWRTDSEAIARAATEGRDAVRRALRELEAAGYLVRDRKRLPTGRWSWDWVVYEQPIDQERVSSPRSDQAQLDVSPGQTSDQETTDGSPTDGFLVDVVPETEDLRLNTETARAPEVIEVEFVPSRTAADAGMVEAARELCLVLADSLRARGASVPRHPDQIKAWVEPMEALVRIDGREPAKVAAVIRWLDSGADSISHWWRARTLSPASLRRHWDAMAQQYHAEVSHRPARHAAVLQANGARPDGAERMLALAREEAS